MILGIAIRAVYVAVGGVLVFGVVLFQILVGTRRVHFKGKMHLLVHKRTAWVLLALAVIHGFMGVVYTAGLRIG